MKGLREGNKPTELQLPTARGRTGKNGKNITLYGWKRFSLTIFYGKAEVIVGSKIRGKRASEHEYLEGVVY